LGKGFVNDGGGHQSTKEIFNSGRFTIQHLDYANNFLAAVKMFEAFPDHTNRNFLSAVEKIMKDDKIALHELAEKFEKYPDLLTSCDSVKSYLRCFEELYNHHLKKRVVIFA
jgi:hypothetical protein